jgi:hypothetical protein
MHAMAQTTLICLARFAPLIFTIYPPASSRYGERAAKEAKEKRRTLEILSSGGAAKSL